MKKCSNRYSVGPSAISRSPALTRWLESSSRKPWTSITSAAPAEDLDAAVERVVAQLLAGGPGALATAKRLIFEIPARQRDDAFQWTTGLSESLFASAEAAGCRTMNGLAMMLHQGAASFELFTGRPMPLAHVREHLFA